MSQKETLYAWTAPGSNYPAYVNISKEGGLITVTVRNPSWLDRNHHVCGDTATAYIPAHEFSLEVRRDDQACTLGVGCDEVGVCYAAAHNQPDKCGAPVKDAAPAPVLTEEDEKEIRLARVLVKTSDHNVVADCLRNILAIFDRLTGQKP